MESAINNTGKKLLSILAVLVVGIGLASCATGGGYSPPPDGHGSHSH